MDKRPRIKLNKGTIVALRLLEERFRNDQKEIIDDCIIEAGEDPSATWEIKQEGSQIFLIKRGPINGGAEIEEAEGLESNA